MNIIYPIYFTLGGRGVRWRESKNKINVTIKYNNGSASINTSSLNANQLNSSFIIQPNPVSGYFIKNGEKIRVTNLVGYDGNSLLKECPACGKIKPIEDFDYEGRDTGGKRDQSNCKDCRSNY